MGDRPAAKSWCFSEVGAGGYDRRSEIAEKAVRILSFLGGVDDLERFLTRSCYLSVGSVPACWGLTVFLVGDVGWHFSFLAACVLPLIAAYLGIRAKREIRTGMSATAFGLAFVSLPLLVALAYVENS